MQLSESSFFENMHKEDKEKPKRRDLTLTMNDEKGS